MKLLVDTHFVLAILERDVTSRFPCFIDALNDPANSIFVSVVSLWEIGIKFRLKKLDAGVPLDEIVPTLDRLGIVLLGLTPSHSVGDTAPEPPTRDPFDRMLIVQAGMEGMQLVTVDRALAEHPVAFRPSGVSKGR
jgi:PIN domain nuclease of toxin-antitoxin system